MKKGLYLIVGVGILIILFQFFNANIAVKPKVATVISVEPLTTNQVIEHEHCNVSGILGPYSKEYLSAYHPAETECTIFYMIETIKNPHVLLLSKHAYRNCFVTQKTIPVTIGYDVIYRIGDTLGKVRSPVEPDKFIPLDDNGQLLLSKSLNEICDQNTSIVRPFYCMDKTKVDRSLDATNLIKIVSPYNTMY